MAPHPEYALWWRLTERCSRLTGDMRDIRWYFVPKAESIRAGDVEGIYYTQSRRIVLAGRHLEDGLVVRHEMLHALIVGAGLDRWMAPLPSHPTEYFERRCGGVVACGEVCTSEGGAGLPWTDRTGPFLRSQDLDVSARADSTEPSISRDSGWTALTVQVRNPKTFAIRLRLTRIDSSYAFATFGYRLAYCEYPGLGFGSRDYYFTTDSVIVLGPGEARRVVYDLHVGHTCFLVKPFFNDDTLPIIRVQPVP